MKKCPKCGAELLDEAVMCPACGEAIEEAVQEEQVEAAPKKNKLRLVALIFMIISIAFSGVAAILVAVQAMALDMTLAIALFSLVPLIWLIPMTVTLKKANDANESLSTGYKVVILLFANLVAGILLLCDKEK